MGAENARINTGETGKANSFAVHKNFKANHKSYLCYDNPIQL